MPDPGAGAWSPAQHIGRWNVAVIRVVHCVAWQGLPSWCILCRQCSSLEWLCGHWGMGMRGQLAVAAVVANLGKLARGLADGVNMLGAYIRQARGCIQWHMLVHARRATCVCLAVS